jgi:hypothetical protein
MTKEAGVISTIAGAPLRMAGRAAMAPAKMMGKGLWSASKKQGGPLAPLLFGGAVLGTAAAGQKAMGQAKSYSQGFNPNLQAAMMGGQ